MKSNFKEAAALDAEYQLKRLGATEILSVSDLKDLNAATQRIFDLLSDGKEHGAEEIIRVGGVRESLRRMRELRSYGYEIKRVRGVGREFYYRMEKTGKPVQTSLFR